MSSERVLLIDLRPLDMLNRVMGYEIEISSETALRSPRMKIN
jgi:hypothetical protein